MLSRVRLRIGPVVSNKFLLKAMAPLVLSVLSSVRLCRRPEDPGLNFLLKAMSQRAH